MTYTSADPQPVVPLSDEQLWGTPHTWASVTVMDFTGNSIRNGEVRLSLVGKRTDGREFEVQFAVRIAAMEAQGAQRAIEEAMIAARPSLDKYLTAA